MKLPKHSRLAIAAGCAAIAGVALLAVAGSHWRSADFFYAGFVISLVVGSATMPLAVAAALVSRRPSLVALRVLSLTATTLCALLLVFAVQAWQPDDEAIRNAAEDAWLDMDSDERSRYGDDASALASEAKDAIAALGWASTALAATLAAAALVAHQLRRALLHSEQLASAEKESKATYEQRLAARRSEAAKRAEEALRGRQRDYAVRDEDAMDEEKAAEPRGPPLTADNFASLDAVAEAQRRRASASTSASRSPVHSSQKGQEKKKKKRKWKGADGRQPLSKVSPHRRGSIGQSSSMASPMAAAAADGTSSHPNSPDAFSAGSPHMPVAMPAPAAPQSPPAQQPPPPAPAPTPAPAPAPAPAPPIAPAPPQQPRSPGAAAGAPVASRNRRIVFFPASGPA